MFWKSINPGSTFYTQKTFKLQLEGVSWGLKIRATAETRIFCCTLHHRVQNGSGAHPASYPMVTGALSLRIKRPGREADHSPLSNAEVKEWVEICLHSPSTPSWRGAQLKHRDNFTFTFTNTACNKGLRNIDNWLGFEPAISTFEQPKTVLASDRSAIETGRNIDNWCN
jgi:hypothetical protein